VFGVDETGLGGLDSRMALEEERLTRCTGTVVGRNVVLFEGFFGSIVDSWSSLRHTLPLPHYYTLQCNSQCAKILWRSLAFS